ncbi:hypothetical protein [uncultured Jatrophihabitans sp.]|uniref:hypothetical protein n=1 Tax=uncultured Jatrophihabitans sp. TaxID=1610747 RepID=UPI0035CB91DB
MIRAVKSARAAEPDLDLDTTSVVALVELNTGVPARLIDASVRYWSSYPHEIDTWIAEAEAIEARATSST